MLSASTAYREAVTADSRRMCIKVAVDISDPDKRFGAVTGSPQAAWSHPEEIHNKVFEKPHSYWTMEPGRGRLDGSLHLFPAGHRVATEQGYVGAELCGRDGLFQTPQVITQAMSGLSVLQACSVWFSTDPEDGVAEDFTLEVIQGGTSYFSRTVTGNQERRVSFDQFTVYDVDLIRLTVSRWSLPGRRMRVLEIVPGIYEEWMGDELNGLDVTQQGSFSTLTLPYGTCRLSIDNQSRRFEPRRKDGIFQSIEERQGLDVFIGPELPDGTVELKHVGLFYQTAEGWKESANEPTIQWNLVDIVGLLASRTFIVPKLGTSQTPAPLPTTLGGWLSVLVSQLGDAFARRYTVDPAYASRPVVANSVEDVTGVSCGDILRWACMATGTWPRAEADTGRLAAEPLWSQGNKVTLDNLTQYPRMQANESRAALIFNLYGTDSEGKTVKTEMVVSGNSTSSEKTTTINNPFIHTADQALAAARLILAQYGGNVYETTGRGDPASEIGDVDTIWLDESNAATARRMVQTFHFQDGVLQGCTAKLLQADGSYLWTGFAVIRRDCVWTSPPGVTELRVVIGAGGQGGGRGQDGYFQHEATGNLTWDMPNLVTGEGEPGVNGIGGKVWFGVIPCNEQQAFAAHLGAGGAAGDVFGEPGAFGEESTFGTYSSENGVLYPGGYTDIANGQVFARTGVPAPLPGTGDGGAGGIGGTAGSGYYEWHAGLVSGGHYEFVEEEEPGPGQPGSRGATGFIMVTWDKNQEAH